MSINELPTELLQAIFELLVGKASGHPSTTHPDDKRRLLQTLTGVCRVWRELTLSNALLWNILHFPTTDGAMQWTKLSIQRSAAAPLDIHIAVQDTTTLKALNTYGPAFFKLIDPESRRWRMMELGLPALLPQISPLWCGEIDMLEELRLESTTISLPFLHTPALPGRLRHLKSLSVARQTLRWTPWECLSIVYLSLGPFGTTARGPSPRELFGILTALSDTLRSLTLKGTWQGYRSDHLFQGPITLKALKSLIAPSGWEPQVVYVIQGCRFPVLEHVEILFSLFYTPPPALVSLLCDKPQLFLSVKHLSLGFVGDANSPMGQVVQRAFPHLEHVVLLPYTALDGSLSILLSRSWGSLTRLDLSEAGLDDIIHLLSKRRQNYPTTLHELRLSVAHGILYRTDYEWIQSHVDRLVIYHVRPDAHGLAFNKDIWPFEERYLVAQAPTQRPQPKQMQTRAL